MPSDRDIYSIYAVRLENFHNIGHVVIPIPRGGHLFLLGDNGSGKTTVLDAIHYVLSAGEQIELNSAARLGGSKADGRRINGVVTRINVETGPLCPDGRVTYAALELRNLAGSSTCIGIGLSIAGADSPLQQWGFRIDAPIGELPLLVKDEEGREYPPDREQLKRILEKSKGRYYTSMPAFARALARDFFPGDSQYDEYRKFLNMCKAYREISSRAGNYHELFKSLLPEPEKELLRDLRLGMKSLRDADAALNVLEKRCQYLQSIHLDQCRIDRIREELRMLGAGLLWFDRRRLRTQLDQTDGRLNDQAAALAGHRNELDQAAKRTQDLARALTDLRNQDATSLIDTEKSRAEELRGLERTMDGLQRGKDAIDTELRRTVDLRRENLDEFNRDLTRLSTILAQNFADFQQLPLAAVQTAVQEAQKERDAAYLNLSLEKLWNLYPSTVAETESAGFRVEALRKAVAEKRDEIKAAGERLGKLRSQPEIHPACFPDYPGLLKELADGLLPVVPLYLKLRWRSSATPAERSAVEELIGEEALGTLVTSPDSLERLREALLKRRCGGVRCAALAPLSGSVPVSAEIRGFLDRYFDSDRDPLYLEVLGRELAGPTVPELAAGVPVDWIVWRGSFRVLRGLDARLIGEEERKAEHRRRLAEAEAALRELDAQAGEMERDLDRKERHLAKLKRFSDNMRTLTADVERLRKRLLDLDDQRRKLETQRQENDFSLADFAGRRETLLETLARLREKIRRQNLQELDARIERLRQVLDEAEATRQRLHDVVLGERLELDRLQEQRQETGTALEEKEQELRQALAETGAHGAEDALEKRLTAGGIGTRGACEERMVVLRGEAAEAKGIIRTKINAPEGIEFGFVYEEQGNELFSREHQTLKAELDRQRTELAQQKEILTEQARRNFESILLEGFRDALRNRIFSLEEMHRKINRMLKGHLFGRNTYSLKIDPVPQYAPLVRIMRDYSDRTLDSREELKDIFEMHASDILDTPANHVPEILDYRNYFSYKMLLHAPGADSRVMDIRTKSVVSGGEQAVPNYLLVMMIAHLLFDKTKGTDSRIKINTILFDEAFYGIDQQRQEQLLSFAEELGLQLMIASPNQDGFKPELADSTNVFVRKDTNYDVHFIDYTWQRDRPLFADEDEIPPGTEL